MATFTFTTPCTSSVACSAAVCRREQCIVFKTVPHRASRNLKRAVVQTRCIAAPTKPEPTVAPAEKRVVPQESELITQEAVRALEAELDNGPSVAALRRFNDALRDLPANQWEARLRPVMNELAYNLESFNPAFTAVLLKVQSTIGMSDYVRRDVALKNLIQPLAGEYGMHNGQDQARTHRELFSMFYADLMREPLEAVLAANPAPQRSVQLFQSMMRDILGGGGAQDAVEQAVYALGYNLAIEYLADYEKTWMLDSFRQLDARVLQPQGRALNEWVFLEVHAEGEAEHAAIGHAAVTTFVPSSMAAVLAKAMRDHDRDFAEFYNYLADVLEQ